MDFSNSIYLKVFLSRSVSIQLSAISLSATRTLREQLSAISLSATRTLREQLSAISYQLSAVGTSSIVAQALAFGHAVRTTL
ncbi:hypothetical protein [Moorena bouillonii]|uniref:hypothetical protein n=1 Tax=Moorena bouillonii TaxID=207920 RepID=UPI00117CFEE7|nr:hypothetical protein [Moorena bouillonii]